ncbi:malto-oligosyltrehalose trehalohydrolase [Pedobacter frigidisoli]|uniref:Malto-oligosyltrehalose trehalohydrolase n=1 Tax=Pedobacter frigidisoli TaxID=2530455 RepID=A0A4R0NZW5_9SPHI|nr:malto-oligosyltrehalose trehalohydrolase [Pedobacter frigidisoli]TCD08441.1 malto-oligosyltrehalose trehalohydrolase [Pedobacter frigidisoli]
MEIDILKRKIGLSFAENGNAEIWLWAPFALSISVLIKASGLKLIMHNEDFGYWFIQTEEIKLEDEYEFEICSADATESDSSKIKYLRQADPASIYQKDGVSGLSTAVNLDAFHWTDQNWKGLLAEDFIIYELHTATFTFNGDFESIESKLDYLVDLGITAIEIMPISQFPGNRNWGYDGVYPFAAQNTYGGPKALQHLVNACHEKGIAVILDVVYNHMGPEGNFLNDFGPYFTNKYQTPWGKAINFDDAYSDPVRDFFIENILMWFRDFHIDALRLDAVHAIKDFSVLHILEEARSYVNRLSAIMGRIYYLHVELDLNDNKYINPHSEKGYGMDAQWLDEFHHALRVAAGQEKIGYYSDFNGIDHLAKSYQDAYVYDGQYSEHRKKKFGIKADENQGKQFIVFSQNHDQVGNRMLGERTSKLVSFEMLKLMAAAVFCSPFLPLIFMGEEYGETNPFQFFTSHSGKDLIEAVKKGRRDEFAAFHNSADVPDPQSEATFNGSKLNWDLLNVGKHQKLLSYYKALINLRKTVPALANLNRNQLEVKAFANQNSLILKRWHNNQQIMCLMNFSAKEQVLPFKIASNYKIIFNSTAQKWGGKQTEEILLSSTTIPIYPESILIFKSEHV